MSKLYQYTVFRTDGTKEVLPPCPKKNFWGEDGLYNLIHCTTIQLVPKVYYGDDMNKRATIYCDEEGLLENKPDNPFFKVHHDMLFNDDSTIVGDAVMEEVYRGDK